MNEIVIKKAKWPLIFSIIGKFFALLWVSAAIYALYFVSPFIISLYSITKIQNSYFEVKINSLKKATYIRVETMPKEWVTLDKISKRLKGAIVTSEDGKFFSHPGFDIKELQDAINDNLVGKKKKGRGASTITQQLIKNLYLKNDRTLSRKANEILLTLWIEKNVDKNKILETYLNVIEYGEGLYGIKNAAAFYFKKKPNDLNARESAFLAMLLPSPKKYAQSFRKKTLTQFATKIVNSILFKMLQSGYIGVDEYLASIESHFFWEQYEKPEIGTEESNSEESINEGEASSLDF
jgi:monofunctional biosynthetic peptidoglycan transglycosylase